MVLMAWDVGPGDAVFVPGFTFCATAEAVVLAGATPVFCDVDEDSFTLDPQSLAEAIAIAQENGLLPRAVIPVDLFGHPADHQAIEQLARTYDLLILDDAAQGFGATINGNRLGGLGDACATSFFPAKPLGCYGDGGAILTNDAVLAETLLAIRIHGQVENKEKKRVEHQMIGLTGRLDTIQAAILLEKLKIFPDELEARARIAESYRTHLSDYVKTPRQRHDITSAWAQYTVRHPNRDELRTKLLQAGIPTAVHYVMPLHRQPAYAQFPAAGSLPRCETLSREVLSLPMHPYIDETLMHRIVRAVKDAC
jgi:dTDP-4-amino-4,6-dideoxygalactose transaminase